MKKKGRAWQLFVVALLILGFAYTAFFGVAAQYGDTQKTYIKGADDIRFGIDIRGGVDVTFMPADGYDATDEQMEAAETVIQQRLVNLNITDSEVYVDYNKDRIIVRFPWKEGESEFNPEAAIREIGTTAQLTFREGTDPNGEVVITGADVEHAVPGTEQGRVVVHLQLKKSGTQAFGAATTELSATSPKGAISIWLDDTSISTATVNEPIMDGNASISGSFTMDEAVTLSNQINSGALPFALSAESYSTISPSLGAKSLDAMVLAGVIAFALVFVYMVAFYRLPGFLACLALLGQVAATLAAVSGYLPIFNSFTLTLPGIAGIILAIGMGVDANVITAERIREELKSGKTLDGAITAGFSRGLAPIIDGNVTIVIVAIVLMGAFGPTDGVFAKLLKPIFFAFGPSTAGTIYSFGYTLLVGVLLNFVFGVVATRLMVRGASRIKALRNPWLYGGSKEAMEIIGDTASLKFEAKRQIIGKRRIFMAISAVIIVAVVACSAIFGVSMDIQFKGGAMLTLGYTGDLVQADAKNAIESVLGKVSVQDGTNTATGDNSLTVTLPGAETVTTDELAAVQEALDAACPDNHFEQLSMSNVNPTIGKEFLQKSIVAVITAVVLIMAYIAFRFRKIGGLPAGVMAVIALLNDLIVVFGVFVILQIPLNGNFIAAMLTILGYSINDTVVMYDRIRENESLFAKKMPFEQLVNLSINQSLRRSINTTVTTCLALATICVIAVVYGLGSIFTFALPLMVGMISGVYTSLCITTSLWTEWESRKGKKTAKSKKA